MNRLEPRSSSWSDEELDSLMTSFFAREMPEALRDETSARSQRELAPVRVAVAETGSATTNGQATRDARRVHRPKAGRAALAVASLAIVACVALVAGPMNSSRQAGGPPGDGPGSADQRGGGLEAVVSGSAASEQSGARPSAAHRTDQGPVELRADRTGTTNVSADGSHPDAEVEVKLEELNIEIIPIDD